MQEQQVSYVEGSTWFLDSNCSRNLTGDRSLLIDIVKCSGPRITFGDDSKGKTVGKGKITHGTTIINDVLLVENLHYNLLSISQMCDV